MQNSEINRDQHFFTWIISDYKIHVGSKQEYYYPRTIKCRLPNLLRQIHRGRDELHCWNSGTRPTLRKAGRITVRTLWAGSFSFGPIGRGPNTSHDPKLIFVFVFLIVEYVPSFSRIYNGGLYTFFICRAGLKFHEIFLKLFDARVWWGPDVYAL